jgi:hypothetical protein
MKGYSLCIDEKQAPQDPQTLSFIGGYPRIPIAEDLPKCQLCGAEQSFFFQVAFPKNHVWRDLSIAVFACTSCDDEKYCVPEMLPPGNPDVESDRGGLYGVHIPEGFLKTYQRNFRFIVFPTGRGERRTEYVPKVAYKKLKLSAEKGCKGEIGIVGGKPQWIQGDETPASYDGHVPMKFLMQVHEDLKFDILPDAPAQMEYDFFSGELHPSPMRYYQLFLGNCLYFFGTSPPHEPLTYVLLQID